jgi:hypothetical protein
MNDLIWSFAPWFVFLAATRFASIYVALTLGTAAAVVVLARAVKRRSVHMLDGFSVVYFVALTTVLIVVRPGHLDDWARYAQAGSHLALTVLVFGSIVLGRPFTESYARATVPQSVRKTVRFHALNRRISAVWGLAFLVGTVSLIVAGSIDVRQILLRIIVPFGSLYYAYVYTQRQVQTVHSGLPERAPETSEAWGMDVSSAP